MCEPFFQLSARRDSDDTATPGLTLTRVSVIGVVGTQRISPLSVVWEFVVRPVARVYLRSTSSVSATRVCVSIESKPRMSRRENAWWVMSKPSARSVNEVVRGTVKYPAS